MSEQTVDLRSTLAILRRHRRALVGAAALGAAAGACVVLLSPPLYTSASLVLLPPAEDASGQSIERDVETEIQIASSDAVLAPAGEALEPPVSVKTLDKTVEVTAPSSDVLRIEASATTPERAQEMARAVADAEVTYITESAGSVNSTQQATLAARRRDVQASLDAVNKEIEKTTARRQSEDPASPEGRADATAMAQLTAQQANLILQIDHIRDQSEVIRPSAGASIIQGASPAKRPGLVARYVVWTLLGIAAAVVFAATLFVMFGRRDRRLRYRDEIADAVGSAVLASIRSHVPRAVAGWSSLLAHYAPGTVDAWALRQALRQLVFSESAMASRRAAQNDGRMRHPASITIISLADDLRGLAMGPQIASYAASAGVRTRLVAAQGHESAAALWAACSGLRGDAEVRPGLMVDTQAGDRQEADLTVVLAVLDRRNPELVDDLPDTTVTILAVSPGSATAEDLARAAMTADDSGSRIAGIIVADPDNLDRTTGRLLEHERSQQVPLPTRLTGVTASEVGGTASGPRRRPH